jgi:hypothetical protein
VQLVGINESAVDVEDESEHREDAHLFELIAFRQGNALSSIGNLGEKLGGIAEMAIGLVYAVMVHSAAVKRDRFQSG